jgi:lysophospholipase L1-like esterase
MVSHPSDQRPVGRHRKGDPLIPQIEKRVVRILALVCLLTVGQAMKCLAASEGIQVPSTDQAISYVGHWGTIERAGQTSMATVNSSSQIYLTFSGQHASGLFDLDGIDYLEQIYVRVDNGAWSLFTIDRSRIEFFPTGLPAGRHRLEIAVKAVESRGNRWLSPLSSAIIFKGFELDSQAKVEPSSPPKRPLLQFFGDSITQGEKVLQRDSGSVKSSDALATYGWLAGEALGTTHAQITFGGQGVISSDSREVPPAVFSFAWNFSGSAVDFSLMPDFIVINQGSNDQPDSSSEFIEAYMGLLREIRKHCAHTQIFALSPFHGDRNHGDDVAEAVTKMADPAIVYIDTTGWLDESDYTDGVHPNVVGSKKAATRLEEVLQPYISRWKSERISGE